jgi:hypothetical protein
MPSAGDHRKAWSVNSVGTEYFVSGAPSLSGGRRRIGAPGIVWPGPRLDAVV